MRGLKMKINLQMWVDTLLFWPAHPFVMIAECIVLSRHRFRWANHQNLLKFLCEWLLWKAEEPNTVYHIVFTNILTFFSSSLLSTHIYGSYDSTNLIFTSLSSDQNSILSLCTESLAFSDADFFLLLSNYNIIKINVTVLVTMFGHYVWSPCLVTMFGHYVWWSIFLVRTLVPARLPQPQFLRHCSIWSHHTSTRCAADIEQPTNQPTIFDQPVATGQMVLRACHALLATTVNSWSSGLFF